MRTHFNISTATPGATEAFLNQTEKVPSEEQHKFKPNTEYFYFNSDKNAFYLLPKGNYQEFLKVKNKELFRFTSPDGYQKLKNAGSISELPQDNATDLPALPLSAIRESALEEQKNAPPERQHRAISFNEAAWALLPLIAGGGVATVMGTTTLPAWAFWCLLTTPVISNAKVWFDKRQRIASDAIQDESRRPMYTPFTSTAAKCFRFFGPAFLGGVSGYIGRTIAQDAAHPKPEMVGGITAAAFIGGTAAISELVIASQRKTRRW